MASVSAIALPPLLLGSNKTYVSSLQKLRASLVSGRPRCLRIVAKAVGDSSDSSSGSIIKFVKNAWDDSEDRIALVGLGFAGIVALWASTSAIGAIDKLPVIPGVFEFIGILFSWWFVYRYLLFKPDREELVKFVKSSISDIVGQ